VVTAAIPGPAGDIWATHHDPDRTRAPDRYRFARRPTGRLDPVNLSSVPCRRPNRIRHAGLPGRPHHVSSARPWRRLVGLTFGPSGPGCCGALPAAFLTFPATFWPAFEILSSSTMLDSRPAGAAPDSTAVPRPTKDHTTLAGQPQRRRAPDGQTLTPKGGSRRRLRGSEQNSVRHAPTMPRSTIALRTALPSPSLLKYTYTSLPIASHSRTRSAHHRKSASW